MEDNQNPHNLSFSVTQLATIRSALSNFVSVDGGTYINTEATKIINNVVERIDTAMDSLPLTELLRNTPLDFGYLSTAELNATYKKLLAIGKDNDLSADENEYLQYLVVQSGKRLIRRGGYEPEHESESHAEQGEEL